MTSQAMRLCLVLLLLAQAGCAYMDPYTRPGAWRPTGVVSRDLAVMVASPADLVRGRGDDGADAPLAANAVTKLWQGNPKPLPATNSQSGGGGAQGGS
jgi:type IV pilus biogenesis protein CpaD/CtpE